MTMEHVAGAQNGGQVPATAGLSQSLLRAPDKYLTANLEDDLTTYICSYSGNSAWVMGEFTMLFDPNSKDGKYYQSGLSFKVYGIVNSTIELGGDFRFTTKPTEGYGFSGPTSKVVDNPGANAKKFLASGAKFLGQFDKLSDQVKAIHDKTNETAEGLAKFTTGPLAKVKQAANFIEQNTRGSSTLKGVLGVASSLGGLFGVAGSIAGLLWPSDTGPTAVTTAPTVSTGSISLKGTIETTTIIGSTFTEEPGVPHNFDVNTNAFVRASQPYYDCPMGLFNLRQTPQLAKRVYPRAKMYSGYRGQVPEESYTSYSVQEDLTPVFNQTSGMQVVSVKAAIVQKVRYSSLESLFDNLYTPTRYNLLYAQIEAGNLEAVPFDVGPTNSPNDDTYLVQTPFVDVGCFKGMAFNAPTDSLTKSPAFIRIIATLRRVNAAPTDAPYYFAQDYAFDAIVPSPANPPGGSSGSGYLDVDEPTPYRSGFTVSFNPPDVTFTGKVFQLYGQFFAAPTSLVFDYASSLSMDVVRNGGASGYGGGSGGFHAGTTISF